MASAPPTLAAARRASVSLSNNPKQVGPDPLTPAPSAPAERRASSGPRRSGRRRSQPRQVVLHGRRQHRRRARGQAPQRLGVELPAPRVQAIELDVHIDRTQALPLGDEHHGEAGELERLHPLPGAGDERMTRLHLAGHVGPEGRPDPAQLVGVKGGRRRSRSLRAAPRRRRRPAAQAGGHGHPLLIRSSSGGSSPPRRSRISVSARAARFSPATPADHGVRRSRRELPDLEVVGQLERGDERRDRMHSVVRGPTCRTRFSFA